jgi:hypothetical protein
LTAHDFHCAAFAARFNAVKLAACCRFFRLVAAVCSLFVGVVVAPLRLTADTHIYAGAVGTNLNDALTFTVASLYDTNSGFRLPMVLRTTGLNVGFYRGDTLTFTALSSTDLGTGQVLGRALLGSRLAVQVVSVEGPAGGAVQFWEGDGENPGNQITFQVPVGETRGTNAFIISENDGEPGSDPYGHIHGREFTTSTSGLYTVGFRLIDVSTNGLGGGPMHSPSAVLPMYFQAGPVIESIAATSGGVRVFFRSAPGVTNVLEASPVPQGGAWTSVSSGLRGNSTLQSIVDSNPTSATRFYRLQLLNTPP